MKFKIVQKVIVFSFLLSLSSASFAGTFSFNILNSGDSVADPITLNEASIAYSALDGAPECESKIPLSQIIGQIPQVKIGKQLTVSYTPAIEDECYTKHGMAIALFIDKVDGKSSYPQCGTGYGGVIDPKANLSGNTIIVTEINERFFCSYLPK